ncbi:S-adenosyl-L-methionine-dependent methyltransferase [Cyathus striatus]|nr:S-adenosyl-L-methionine-dependent methyltransferase [Cyathus striatus]
MTVEVDPVTLPQPEDVVVAVKSPRYVTSYPGARYVIPSDSEEKQRLIRQHFLLKRVFKGNNLLAPVDLKDGDKVLEIGTGTGIWLMDFATSIPDTIQLYGTDIESRLFPTDDIRSPNAQFSVASVTSLPEDWSNTFSVVHQRLLIAGLTEANWIKGINEVHRVLKPGGWIELCEHTSKWIGGPSYTFFWESLANFYDSVGLVGHCARWLLEAGFEDVTVVEQVQPTGAWAGEEGLGHKNNLMNVFRALKPAIVKAGGMGSAKTNEEMDELLDKVQHDMDQPGTTLAWVKCYGRKTL